MDPNQAPSLGEVLRANALDPTQIKVGTLIVIVSGNLSDPYGPTSISVIDKFVSFDPSTCLLRYGGAHTKLEVGSVDYTFLSSAPTILLLMAMPTERGVLLILLPDRWLSLKPGSCA